MQLPDVIQDEQELDELLSRPGVALVDFMRRLDGDIMVLGAGGKIGPTLTRLAARAIGAASAFLTTEKSFRRIMGYDQLWILQSYLDGPDETDVKVARKVRVA